MKDVQMHWNDARLPALVEFSRMSTKDLNDFKRCLQSLNRLTQVLGRDWCVLPFGSSANGFGITGSDLDVTCYRPHFSEQDRLAALHELKVSFVPILQQDPSFEVVEAVWAARIPILRLKFEGSLDVDLSLQNSEALLNTDLLKTYAKLHPTIRRVVLAVKLWAKALGLSGAPKGHLSSYSLTLMAIYFLQVHPDLQMPCVPPEAFTQGARAADFEHLQWDCQLPVHELLSRFFYFYAWEFEWGTEVVSIRLGQRLYAGSPEFHQLPGQTYWRLHVEDPFLLGRNLNCVLGAHQETVLKEQLTSAAMAMGGGYLPEGLKGLVMDAVLKGWSSSPSDSDHSTSVPGTSKASDSDMEDTQGLQRLAMAAPHPDDVPMTGLAFINVKL
eukprot:TRINITY_DN14149_c0_g2_i1.p1 TRINITY_DN14149_c0_g2~~TRINITY_DN14149_c0_g2_i1.p1  ORF type:complete len:385 (+),score=87.34 TRINITY_DN14149_c0_g2_i1:55-1209(+)